MKKRKFYNVLVIALLCTMPACTGNEDDSDANELMTLQLLSSNDNFTGDFDQSGYEDHIGEGHSPGFQPLLLREAVTAEVQALLDANASGTVTASGSLTCAGGGSIAYTFSADLNLSTYTDTMNKSGTITNGVRTFDFKNCRPHDRISVQSGYIRFEQSGGSSVEFTQSGATLTVTSAGKIFAVNGGLTVARNGSFRSGSADVSVSLRVEENSKVARFSVNGGMIGDLTPVSVRGSITGTIKHMNPRGDRERNIQHSFDRVF
ncbi:MAG: hypothetical protein KDK30_05515 [Leptospiraceae bacterium]|nr:hypothetical protein [Leptospiraceae bacterium]MCB1322103.1 hypothetical protein [Leptospiraceae bacterium]